LNEGKETSSTDVSDNNPDRIMAIGEELEGYYIIKAFSVKP